MPLLDRVKIWVIRNLPHDSNDANFRTHLNSLDASDLLTIYHNWISRLIRPKPRRVLKSKALLENPVVAERMTEIEEITRNIEKGEDLSRYLSKDIRVGVQVPGQKGRRRDLDLMINDWRVHHLHLSNILMHDGFVKRDDRLLFACFNEETAYLIDVMRHGDWTRDHILEVLIDEWPAEGLVHHVRGAIGLQREVSEEDRKVLRSKHINSAFEYKGSVYSPVGMMSVGGTSMYARRAADQVCEAIERFEGMYRDRESEFRTKCFAQGVDLPNEPHFDFEIREGGCGIIETETRTWFPINTH